MKFGMLCDLNTHFVIALVVCNHETLFLKACKGLTPKFSKIVKDEKYANIPIVWADLTIQHNKDFVKSLGGKRSLIVSR